mmetsp:Transcript_5064/g.11215  ORF Transcript_5064/g.11215 Transcript_5064/m.11215 type:complete len:84 (-) Transcript_5064:186-437(-)
MGCCVGHSYSVNQLRYLYRINLLSREPSPNHTASCKRSLSPNANQYRGRKRRQRVMIQSSLHSTMAPDTPSVTLALTGGLIRH